MSNNSTSELRLIELADPTNSDEDYDSCSTTLEPRPAVREATQMNFLLRLFLFCFVEVSFIVLAAVCLAKPLPLHITFGLNDARVKGGFADIFVVWHSLAVFVGGCIPTDVFSREWSVQLTSIVPGTTDRVSTINSGFSDRISHIFTKHASGTFKLAFLTSLTLMILTHLAPGTISVTAINDPILVDVARQLSQVTDVGQLLTSSQRANSIIQLEKIGHSSSWFKLPPNTLVSLPPNEFNGTLEYNTDIVKFHHDCRWEVPSIFNSTSIVPGMSLFISAAGKIWSTMLTVGGQANAGSSISPLSLTNITVMMNTSTTAYLFIGGNSTFLNSRTTPPTPFAINLGNLPALFVEQGVGVMGGPDIWLVGPLASVLLCDLHPSISGGRVHLAADGTVDVISSGQPPDGSFPSSAANLIFSNAFQDALLGLDTFEIENLVNSIAADTFLANGSVDWSQAQNIGPLDIPSINKNLDDLMSSAAKAFIDGYRNVETNASPSFDVTSVPGVGKEQRLALTTSKELFIVTTVLDVIAIVLLYTLLRSSGTRKRYPFDLKGIVLALSEDPTRHEFLFNPTMAREKEHGVP